MGSTQRNINLQTKMKITTGGGYMSKKTVYDENPGSKYFNQFINGSNKKKNKKGKSK